MSDVPLRLTWTERADGLWNAECLCGAMLAGVRKRSRSVAESLHAASDAEEIRRLNERLTQAINRGSTMTKEDRDDLATALRYIALFADNECSYASVIDGSRWKTCQEYTTHIQGIPRPGCLMCEAREFVARVKKRIGAT